MFLNRLSPLKPLWRRFKDNWCKARWPELSRWKRSRLAMHLLLESNQSGQVACRSASRQLLCKVIKLCQNKAGLFLQCILNLRRTFVALSGMSTLVNDFTLLLQVWSLPCKVWRSVPCKWERSVGHCWTCTPGEKKPPALQSVQKCWTHPQNPNALSCAGHLPKRVTLRQAFIYKSKVERCLAFVWQKVPQSALPEFLRSQGARSRWSWAHFHILSSQGS